MDTSTPFPPPVPPSTHVDPSPAVATEPRRRLQHPVALFSAAVAIASGVAAIAAIAIGVATAALSATGCSANDGWCELGALFLGMLVGMAAGAVAYVVTAVLFINRYRPFGNRAGYITAVLTIPPTALAVLGMLAEQLQ